MSKKQFNPGKRWLDISGKHIQAHGGGVIYHQGRYYWYGEDKSNPTYSTGPDNSIRRVDVKGVACYSSENLYDWQHEGVVLKAITNDPDHPLHPKKVCERPKVIFNEKTQKFVMWLHLDSEIYDKGRSGVAIADSPTGPFEFLECHCPNGWQCRDLALYKDDDGKGYLIVGSGKWHNYIQIAELNASYTQLSGEYSMVIPRPGPPEGREAPAVFKRQGKYYMITSGTTGWSCNRAEYAMADNIFGPWRTIGNPCIGEHAELTFHSQSTFVLPVEGKQDIWIFMADRWTPENLGDSRYVWLPIQFDGEAIKITWHDNWSIDDYD